MEKNSNKKTNVSRIAKGNKATSPGAISINIDLIEDGFPHPLSRDASMLLTSTAGCASSGLRYNLVRGSLPVSDTAKAALALGTRFDGVIAHSSVKMVAKWIDIIGFTIRSHYSQSKHFDRGEFSLSDDQGRFSYIRGVSELMFSLHNEKGTLKTWKISTSDYLVGLTEVAEAIARDPLFRDLIKLYLNPDPNVLALDPMSFTDYLKDIMRDSVIYAAFPSSVDFPNAAEDITTDASGFRILNDYDSSFQAFFDMIASVISYSLSEILSMITGSETAILSDLDDKTKFDKFVSKWNSSITGDALSKDANGDPVVNKDKLKFNQSTKDGSSLLNDMVNSARTEITKSSSKAMIEAILISNRYAAGLHTMTSFYSDQAAYLNSAFNNTSKVYTSYRSLVQSIASTSTPELLNTLVASFLENESYSKSAANMLKVLSEFDTYADPAVLTLIMENISSAKLTSNFNESAARSFATLSSSPDSVLPSGISFVGGQMALASSYVPSVVITSQGALSLIDGTDPGDIIAAAGLSPNDLNSSSATLERQNIFSLLLNNALCNADLRVQLVGGVRKMSLSQDYSFSVTAKDDMLTSLRKIEGSLLIEGAAQRLTIEIWILNKLLAFRDVLAFFIQYDANVASDLIHSSVSEKASERSLILLGKLDDILDSIYSYLPTNMRSHPIAGVLPRVMVNGSSDTTDSYSILQKALFSKSGYTNMLDFIITLSMIFKAVGAESKTLSQTTNVMFLSRDIFVPFYSYMIAAPAEEEAFNQNTVQRLIIEQTSAESLRPVLFRTNDDMFFHFSQKLSTGPTDANLNDWNFDDIGIRSISEHQRPMMKAPEFVGSILTALMNDRLAVTIHADRQGPLRFSKFIRKYGPAFAKLLTLAPTYIEGSFQIRYNTIISEPRLRKSDMLDSVLGMLGLSTQTALSPMEARAIRAYITHMEDNFPKFPLETVTTSAQDSYVLEDVVKMSENFQRRSADSGILTFYTRSPEHIASLFEHTISVQDAADSTLLIVDRNELVILDSYNPNHFITITGKAELPHYMPVDNSMAQSIAVEIADQFANMFDDVFVASSKSAPKEKAESVDPELDDQD